MSIKINDRVRVTVGSEKDSVGEVVNIHKLSVDDIAIVNVDGEMIKVPISALEKEAPKTDTVEELPEGAKRITFEETFEALQTAIDPNTVLGEKGKDDSEKTALISMSCMLTGSKIISDLFGDNDEIVITKAQFMTAIADAVKLENLRKDVNGEMSDVSLMIIGLTNAFVLKKMIPILFGDGSENA